MNPVIATRWSWWRSDGPKDCDAVRALRDEMVAEYARRGEQVRGSYSWDSYGWQIDIRCRS